MPAPDLSPPGAPRRTGVRAAALTAAAAIMLLGTPALATAEDRQLLVSASAADPVASSPSLAAPVLPPADEPQEAPAGPNGSGVVVPQDPQNAPMSLWTVLGLTLLVLVSLGLTAVAATTLLWMLHAWRTPQALSGTRFSSTPLDPRHSFSLLVPARHEQEVLGDTLDALAVLDHPDYEVLAIIGHDDPETEAVARAAAQRHPDRVRVVMDYSVPKNKPKGMNTALPECRGDVVGVFDAEDEVHPRLLRLVDARFTETGADVVQGGVQLMNVQSSWWALRNCMEYYFWFRSRLHFHAEARFIPLGGNTVFLRTDRLREAGGWDVECLAEDCEIGVRLSTQGARVAVAYDPEVVTREETPGSLTSLYKQRTRWSQGFLQVLKKGEWRKLPTRRQRLLAQYTLAMPFLQAFTGLMIPLAIVLMLTAKVPPLVAMITFLPLVPTLVTLAVEAAGVGDFARNYGVKLRPRDYLRLVLGTLPYQVLLAGAAVRAVVREARGDGSWEKTEHVGAHRSPAAAYPAGPAAAVRQPAPVAVGVSAAPPAVIDLRDARDADAHDVKDRQPVRAEAHR
jgi:cellulose synthase/poly-beta-1,6-N-acetylglucosamine synthase-like glycosyltransferase